MRKTFYQQTSTNISIVNILFTRHKGIHKKARGFNALTYILDFSPKRKNVFIGAKRNHRPKYVCEQQRPPRYVFYIFFFKQDTIFTGLHISFQGVNSGAANMCSVIASRPLDEIIMAEAMRYTKL